MYVNKAFVNEKLSFAKNASHWFIATKAVPTTKAVRSPPGRSNFDKTLISISVF